MKKPPITKPKHGPEYGIQEELREFLEVRGWMVERFANNALQMGIPDLYAHHPTWGGRWIDVKVEGRYSFTRAQKIKWPQWEKFNCGVWILVAASEAEYAKLMGPPNFRTYWKPSWDHQYDFEALYQDMYDEAANKAGPLALHPRRIRNGSGRSAGRITVISGT